MRSDFNLCHYVFLRGKTPIENVIEWHALESIFRARTYVAFPDVWNWPIADWLIIAGLGPSRFAEHGRNRHEYALRNLKALGSVLLSARTPWWTIAPYEHPIGFFHWLEHPQSQSKSSLKLQTPDSEILFGIFSLFAVALEAWEQRKEAFFPFRTKASLADAIKKSDVNFLQFIRWIFVARFETVPEDTIVGEFNRCRFGPQQQAFISRWVNTEINLVAIPPEL